MIFTHLELWVAVFNLSNKPIKPLWLETRCVFKHQELQMFDYKLSKYNMGDFYPLGRGSETQLQVGENSNYLILRLKG